MVKNIKKCRCGCGKFVPSAYKGGEWIRGHYMRQYKTIEERIGIKRGINYRKKCSIRQKGKSMEERYGREKAIIIKTKMIQHSNRGKTWEDIVGIKKAKEIKNKISKSKLKNKNDIVNYYKNFVEKNGRCTLKQIKKYTGVVYVTILNKFGSIENFEKISRIKFISKKELIQLSNREKRKTIIKSLQDLVNRYGNFKKTDLIKFYKQGDIPLNIHMIRRHFGSLDKLAEYSNIYFEKQFSKLGKLGLNESKILDDIERSNQIKIERQVAVGNYFVDGYDRKNNIIYEVDEPPHKGRMIEDHIREKQIIENLSCKFTRIRDGW
jgi:hypothetical protein